MSLISMGIAQNDGTNLLQAGLSLLQLNCPSERPSWHHILTVAFLPPVLVTFPYQESSHCCAKTHELQIAEWTQYAGGCEVYSLNLMLKYLRYPFVVKHCDSCTSSPQLSEWLVHRIHGHGWASEFEDVIHEWGWQCCCISTSSFLFPILDQALTSAH